MGKGRYGITDAEVRKYRTSCPGSVRIQEGVCRILCGSAETCITMLPWGGFKECHKCKHVWGWTDGRGSPISREEYEARHEKYLRVNQGVRPEHRISEGGAEMAKEKKAKAEKQNKGKDKGAKAKTVKVKEKKQPVPRKLVDGKTMSARVWEALNVIDAPTYTRETYEKVKKAVGGELNWNSFRGAVWAFYQGRVPRGAEGKAVKKAAPAKSEEKKSGKKKKIVVA